MTYFGSFLPEFQGKIYRDSANRGNGIKKYETENIVNCLIQSDSEPAKIGGLPRKPSELFLKVFESFFSN